MVPHEGFSATTVGDAPLAEIIGGQLDGDRIAGEDADIVLAHFARDVCGHDMTIFQFHAKHGVG